jgi:hypothetical protein
VRWRDREEWGGGERERERKRERERESVKVSRSACKEYALLFKTNTKLNSHTSYGGLFTHFNIIDPFC